MEAHWNIYKSRYGEYACFCRLPSTRARQSWQTRYRNSERTIVNMFWRESHTHATREKRCPHIPPRRWKRGWKKNIGPITDEWIHHSAKPKKISFLLCHITSWRGAFSPNYIDVTLHRGWNVREKNARGWGAIVGGCFRCVGDGGCGSLLLAWVVRLDFMSV